MKDGVCPKCGSREVFKRKSSGHVVIWLSWFGFTTPTNFVCADCGYVEWYVEDSKGLDDIRNNWDTATKAKRKR